jgi:hypothetical protein
MHNNKELIRKRLRAVNRNTNLLPYLLFCRNAGRSIKGYNTKNNMKV